MNVYYTLTVTVNCMARVMALGVKVKGFPLYINIMKWLTNSFFSGDNNISQRLAVLGWQC